jgi:hypothetical protein
VGDCEQSIDNHGDVPFASIKRRAVARSVAKLCRTEDRQVSETIHDE